MDLFFSVDLEPNKDGTFEDVGEAMRWYDDVVPSSTIYATYRVASEKPGIVEALADNHEIGVHVHPREHGEDHDQLAELPRETQRELITATRNELASVTRRSPGEIVAFRAGRHSANQDTLAVLSELGFTVDASVNAVYDEYLPASLRTRNEPFRLESGLTELPTTADTPRLLSRIGVCMLPTRLVTASASTVRTDRWLCSGEEVVSALFRRRPSVSMYMHPYDATGYHLELENAGHEFRRRIESLFESHPLTFKSAREATGE